MGKKQVILATAEMGFGHLRALYPFCNTQQYKLIVLGQTDGSKTSERILWKSLEWNIQPN